MAADRDTLTLYDGSEFAVLERPMRPEDPLVMRFVLTHECGAPPPHVHPRATEVFEVQEGGFELLVGSDWRPVRAGESVTVPPGTRHTFRNRSGAPVVVRNVHDPHHGFEAYLRTIARLSHEIEATAPNSPGAAVRMAMLWGEHDDLIEPADAPLRIAFAALRTIGRALRLKPPA